jgi:uncharacterized protein DUF4386
MNADRLVQHTGRAAGACYLFHFFVGAIAMAASSRIIVRDDAVMTANNLVNHEAVWRLASIAYLFMPLTYIAVTALLYFTFKAVNPAISVLAAFFSLTGCGVLSAGWVFYAYSFSLVHSVQQLFGFTLEQRQDLALTLLRMHGQSFNSSMVFFGCYCILLGFLVYRSGMLPRTIGLLLGFAGIAWLTFLIPALVKSLSPYILLPGLIGEGSLTLWLLVKGVEQPRLAIE